MRLSEISRPRPMDLGGALRTIYGRPGQARRPPKSQLYSPIDGVPRDSAGANGIPALPDRAGSGRYQDPGVPWRNKYRKFFRIGNDGDMPPLNLS